MATRAKFMFTATFRAEAIIRAPFTSKRERKESNT